MENKRQALSPGDHVQLDVHDVNKLRMLSSAINKEQYEQIQVKNTLPHGPDVNPIVRALNWYLEWAIPGLGMFSEACELLRAVRGMRDAWLKTSPSLH